MSDEVILLKNGTETRYFCCDACGHFARGISKRGWCFACEAECTRIGKIVRKKLSEPLQGYFMRTVL